MLSTITRYRCEKVFMRLKGGRSVLVVLLSGGTPLLVSFVKSEDETSGLLVNIILKTLNPLFLLSMLKRSSNDNRCCDKFVHFKVN